jgi:hypothetical protein
MSEARKENPQLAKVFADFEYEEKKDDQISDESTTINESFRVSATTPESFTLPASLASVHPAALAEGTASTLRILPSGLQIGNNQLSTLSPSSSNFTCDHVAMLGVQFQ